MCAMSRSCSIRSRISPAGKPFEAFFQEALDEARRRIGARDYGVESNFILCASIATLPLDTAHLALDAAAPFRDRIMGFGLDSVEDAIRRPSLSISTIARDRKAIG